MAPEGSLSPGTLLAGASGLASGCPSKDLRSRLPAWSLHTMCLGDPWAWASSYLHTAHLCPPSSCSHSLRPGHSALPTHRGWRLDTHWLSASPLTFLFCPSSSSSPSPASNPAGLEAIPWTEGEGRPVGGAGGGPWGLWGPKECQTGQEKGLKYPTVTGVKGLS